jgi:phosphoribosylformylglycinamidine synthase PurS subunit
LYLSCIKVTLRKSILDPQGKTVEHSIQSLGYKNVKYIELKIDAGSENDAKKITDEICKKLLANPVMEDYEFSVIKLNGTA